MGNEATATAPAEPKTEQADELKAVLVGIRKQVEDGSAAVQVAAGVNEAWKKALDQRLADLEASIRGRRGVGEIPKEDAKLFSFLKMFACMADKVPLKEWGNYRFADRTTAGFEAECIKHAEPLHELTRTQFAGTDSLGGYLVPPQVGQDLIDRLRAAAIVFGLGAQSPALTGVPFTLPKLTGGVTSYWLAESGSATKSTAAFGQVAWNPRRLMSHTKISRQLVMMSNPSVEAILRNDMALSMALAVDIAALEGTGADGQPLGLVSSNYLTATPAGLLGSAQRLQGSTNGDPLSWIIVQNLIGILEDANALRGNLGFATNPKVMRKLRLQTAEMYSGQATGLGMPIFAPLISDAVIAQATGYPWSKTTQISTARTKGGTSTCGTLYFGNWSEMFIPTWGAMEFRASDTTGDSTGSALTGDLLWIVAKLLTDVNVRHVESFAFNPELTTA